MTKPKGANREEPPSAPNGLKAQAHQELMDLLRMANESTNPAIQEAIVKIAVDTSEQHNKNERRVSPTLIVLLASLIVIVAACGCWAAYDRFPEQIAFRICLFIFGFVVVLVAVYALHSGFLSESGFVKLISMVWDRITGSTTTGNAEQSVSLKAQEAEQQDEG